MAKMGRKTQCTPEVIKQIADNIALGLKNDDAAVLAGVTRTTFYNWLRWAEKELALARKEDREPDEEKTCFIDFLEAINRARPKRKQALIGRIQLAAQGGGETTETKRLYRTDEKGRPVLTEEVVITRPITSQWQAAAWLLERMHPDEFGRRQTLDIKDWRESLPEGADPDEIERQFLELMAVAADQIEDDPEG